jgi:hypothetical protein
MTSYFALYPDLYRKVRGFKRALLAGLTFGAMASVSAAPLDVFLTATPESIAPRAYLELVSDHMNESLDFFKVRENDPLTAGTKAGDYHGAYLSGGVRVAQGVWLQGALGQRSLSSTSDTFHYTNWHISGLYRFAEPAGNWPALALRMSAWGNYASATESTTAVVVPGAKLNTVKITDPADRQLQADLIGTWKLTPSSDMSAFVSLGSSQLSYGALSATTTRNGCAYNVAFTGNTIFATLAPPCSMGGGIVQQFYDSSGSYGVDVASEIAWRGSFVQAGVNGSWQRGPWTLQAGYLVHVVKRENVDDILVARGNPSYTTNQNITLQGTYRVQPHISVFARGQLTSNLFFNDIPVTYNSSTSERFGSKYTLFSLGLRSDF